MSLPEGAAATAGGILETGLERTERVDGRKAEGWWVAVRGTGGTRAKGRLRAQEPRARKKMSLLGSFGESTGGVRETRSMRTLEDLLLASGLGAGGKTKERSGQGAHPFPVRYALSQGHVTRAGLRLAGSFILLTRSPPLFCSALALDPRQPCEIRSFKQNEQVAFQ